MSDTLAPRALIGAMTPAMNSVAQPELELLRPAGVTNQMQRFRLGGTQVSDDLLAEAEKLMDCRPQALAIVLTTDAAEGGVEKLAARTAELASALDLPVFNASQANHAALKALGARRIAVVTPFNAEVDARVRANVEAAGFEVAAIKGTEAPTLEAICATPLDDVRRVFREVVRDDIDAILQVGTALPVVGLIAELEDAHCLPVVASNAAVYWQVLRALGLDDPIAGYGRLFAEH